MNNILSGRLRRISLPLLLLLLLNSCMHKDVMSDPADDVAETILYSGKEGTFIITLETIFQATSKSSGGGISHTSGYEESRLTVYDFGTGAIVSRVELGENDEAMCEILGITDNKLWLYSIDPELGLHSRNPKTLEVVDKESGIAALKGKSMARPEYTQIEAYYGFDFGSQQIMLTDLQGVRYLFDPIKKVIAETDLEIEREDWSQDYLSSNGYFEQDSFLSFDGKGDRQKLIWRSNEKTAELAFTKPSVFIDLNPIRIAKRKADHVAELQAKVDLIASRLDSLGAKPEGSHGAISPRSHMNEDEYKKQQTISQLQYDLQHAKDDVEHEVTWPNDFDNYCLNSTPNQGLIYSATNVSDTAAAVLSLVEWNGKKFDQRWQVTLPGFYFNPDEAEGAGVFDEGDPEFRYRWAEIHDGKFVMIAQLKMISIDMSTGKKLWEISL